jgi:hypothetical protein
MRQCRALWARLRGMFGGELADTELSAELESHLLMHIDDNLRSGMSPDQARRDALIKLGGVEQARQVYRERKGLPWLETLCQDLRFGLRQLRKNPGFTTVAILTLALGIGANTAIFSFVDALFLKPLAVSSPEQLMRIYAKGPSGHYGAGFSYSEFKLLRDHNSSFTALSVEAERPQLHLVTEGDSEEIRGEFVSSNYLNLSARWTGVFAGRRHSTRSEYRRRDQRSTMEDSLQRKPCNSWPRNPYQQHSLQGDRRCAT